MNYIETVDGAGLRRFLHDVKMGIGAQPVTFLCIGTDRSSGDALGPLVGTSLRKAGFVRVIGTLEEPCDANTLPAFLSALQAVPDDSRGVVIAVDAGLGRAESVGKYQVSAGPVLPGASLGRELPGVGDYGIAGIVNTAGPRNKFAVLQTTSLHRVMGMAEQIVSAVSEIFGNG
ncbi:spore protease YyaC [Paenibacillus thermotolerans]|uniref:spore protease YyaC n=1 Tax=Paenibacillus thermotolerans TaxID=3027807 RepID=UPI0023680DE3|nr:MULTISPECIES: spore protease YyaC [unclassified Paenibacillus]